MCLHGVDREENLTLKNLEINSVVIWHGMLWSNTSSCISDLVHNGPEFTGLPISILFGTVSQHTMLIVRKYCKIFRD